MYFLTSYNTCLSAFLPSLGLVACLLNRQRGRHRERERDTNMMRPSAVHSLSPVTSTPCLTSGRLHNRRLHLHLHHRHRLSAAVRLSSTKGEGDGTSTNDEGVMTALRTRIKEITEMDRVQEEDWEKELSYTFYESEVCELLGLMHLCLTRTPPRLVIGIKVMVTMHVPTSVLVAAMHVVDAAKGILGELNL